MPSGLGRWTPGCTGFQDVDSGAHSSVKQLGALTLGPASVVTVLFPRGPCRPSCGPRVPAIAS